MSSHTLQNPNKRKKVEESREEMKEKTPSQELLTQQQLRKQVELMSNELRCPICEEEFVEAITLNCAHTFCYFCITAWKKNKKRCPICMTLITSECRSLVLDSLVNKVIDNQSEEDKKARQKLVKFREEYELDVIQESNFDSSNGIRSLGNVSNENESVESVNSHSVALRNLQEYLRDKNYESFHGRSGTTTTTVDADDDTVDTLVANAGSYAHVESIRSEADSNTNRRRSNCANRRRQNTNFR